MLGEIVVQHVLGGDPFHQDNCIFRKPILEENVAIILLLLAPNHLRYAGKINGQTLIIHFVQIVLNKVIIQ